MQIIYKRMYDYAVETLLIFKNVFCWNLLLFGNRDNNRNCYTYRRANRYDDVVILEANLRDLQIEHERMQSQSWDFDWHSIKWSN